MQSGNEPLALSAAKGKHLRQPTGRDGPLRFFATLSMTRRRRFFMACRMLAPYAGLPDSSYTTRQRRPPARGGPTLDGRLVPRVDPPRIVDTV